MPTPAPQRPPSRGTNHSRKSRHELGKVPERTRIHTNLADDAGKAFRDFFNAVLDEYPAAKDILNRDEGNRLKGARPIPKKMARDLVFRLQKRLVPECLSGSEFTSRFFMQPAFLNVTSTVPMYTAALPDHELRKRGFDPKDIKNHRLSDHEIAKNHRWRTVVTVTDAKTIEVLISDGVASKNEARGALSILKTTGVYRNATYRRLVVDEATKKTAAVVDIDLGPFTQDDIKKYRRENAPRLPVLIPAGIDEALARVLTEALVADGVVSKNGAQNVTEALATRLREMAPRCANAFAVELGSSLDAVDALEPMLADARRSGEQCARENAGKCPHRNHMPMTMLLFAIANICVPESH